MRRRSLRIGFILFSELNILILFKGGFTMAEQTKSEEISKILLEVISDFDTPDEEKTKFEKHSQLIDLMKGRNCIVNQSEISKHLKKEGIYKSKDGYYIAPVKLIAHPGFIKFAEKLILNKVNFNIEVNNPESKLMILSIEPKFSSLLMNSFKLLTTEKKLKVFLFPNAEGELLLIYNSKSEKDIKSFPKRIQKLATYIKYRNEASVK